MESILLKDQYIIIDPDGDLMTHTITDEKMIAVCQHLADAVPSSVVSNAIEKGWKLVKCDILFTHIKEVDHRI